MFTEGCRKRLELHCYLQHIKSILLHCDMNAREEFCTSFYKKCIIPSRIGTSEYADCDLSIQTSGGSSLSRQAQSPFLRSLSLALTEVLPGLSHSSVSWVFPGVSFGGNRAINLHQ